MCRCISLLTLIVVLSGSIKQAKASCGRFEEISVLINRHDHPDFHLPLTTHDAQVDGWEYVTKEETYNLDFYRYIHYDIFYTLFYQDELVGVAPVYESSDQITTERQKDSGTREGLPIAREVSMGTKLTSRWRKVADRGWGWSAMFDNDLVFNGKSGDIPVRYAMILFVDPEVLKQKETPPCTQNVVYFKGTHTQWLQVPSQVSDIPTQLPQLVKQGCFDQRGNYYFYNLQKDTAWRDFHGFFALYDHDERLSGFGVMLLNSMNESGERWLYPDRQVYSAFQIYTEVLIPYRHEIIVDESISFNNKLTEEGVTALYVMTNSRHHDFKCGKKSVNA